MIKTPTKPILGLFVVVLAVGAVVFRADIRDAYIELRKPPVPSEQPRPTQPPLSASVPVRTPVFSRTPAPTGTADTSVNLAVPFSSQAPRGDWSLPWQEACEETSALLVDAYWNGQSPSVEAVEATIRSLVAWQQSTFGYYQHTTAAQTARMIREYFGYRRVDVIPVDDIEDITSHLRAGRPVIVPLAGRELGNPYYTHPGPVYHMMVAKGVTEDGDIITNDVGTRHGRNLTYDPGVFLAAVHDVPSGGDGWPASVDPVSYVNSGQRVVIVVYPNE